jgi:hypothetical protein
MGKWFKSHSKQENLQAPLLVMGALLAALALSACGTSGEEGVQVGDPAPGFTLPAASGDQISLADYRGSKSVLLYFHMADG